MPNSAEMKRACAPGARDQDLYQPGCRGHAQGLRRVVRVGGRPPRAGPAGVRPIPCGCGNIVSKRSPALANQRVREVRQPLTASPLSCSRTGLWRVSQRSFSVAQSARPRRASPRPFLALKTAYTGAPGPILEPFHPISSGWCPKLHGENGPFLNFFGSYKKNENTKKGHRLPDHPSAALTTPRSWLRKLLTLALS
jgi:hypothetical protein